MSLLLREIKKTDGEAARMLERAGFNTDSDIQSLTREDLRDLFPGPQKLKQRKNIFEIIHKQKPIDLLLEEMKAFIPDESFRAALSENGVLAEYLKILKGLKTQMNNVQAFLDAHIDLLENVSQNQANHETNGGMSSLLNSPYPSARPSARLPQQTQGCLPSTSTPPTYGPVEPYKVQNSQQGLQSISSLWNSSYPSARPSACLPQQTQVICRIIVAGTTFNAHMQLLEIVKNINNQHLDLVCLNLEESPSNQDYPVTIVFCPNSSRIGTDVEAAMSNVTDAKPVILVVMNHTHEAKNTSPMRTWGDYANVVLHVSVFYHEKHRGLLNCPQNNAAACEIRKELLKYSIKKSEDSSRMAADGAGFFGKRWW